jgi:hypothetical protein
LDQAGQLPTGSASQLNMYGQIWFVFVKMQPGFGVVNGDRKRIIDTMNAELAPVQILVKRGFQDDDPVARCTGRQPTKYAALFAEVGSQQDGGKGSARLIVQWLDGTRLLSSFDRWAELEICAATQFCEVGRGYKVDEFRSMVEAIAGASGPQGARNQWKQIATEWAPATLYKNDVKDDYQPTPGDDVDESMSDSSSDSS